MLLTMERMGHTIARNLVHVVTHHVARVVGDHILSQDRIPVNPVMNRVPLATHIHIEQEIGGILSPIPLLGRDLILQTGHLILLR